MLTDKQIEDIALKYTRECGGYETHEDAVPERDVIDFARDIEKAVLFEGIADLQRENAELQELISKSEKLLYVLERDKDVSEKKWWLDQRAQLAEEIDNAKRC